MGDEHPNGVARRTVLAGAGKNVLCEKPMATSAAEARSMIDACAKAGTKLMIAYRCQYEVYNHALAERARAGDLGAIQLIDAVNVQNQGDPTPMAPKEGAGRGRVAARRRPLLSQHRARAARRRADGRVRRDPQPARRPPLRRGRGDGVVHSHLSVRRDRQLRDELRRARASQLSRARFEAVAEIENAFAYEVQRLRLTRRDGKGEANKNQFSLEIDHMAQCVRSGTQPRTPGEEGLQDQVLMAAIYESARTGRPVRFPAVPGIDRFRGPMPRQDA